MSGFEIAGIVLGGLPLVIKAAEGYKKGLEPLEKWYRYKYEFRSFLNDVDIEKQMFEGLCDRLLNYSQLTPEQKLILLQGRDTTGWCRKEVEQALKSKLGLSCDACQFLLHAMNDDLERLQEMLSLKDGSVEWVRPGADKWHYQRKRIAHSFSKKGPETVASLVKNNRRFRDLLDIVDQRVTIEKSSQQTSNTSDSKWAEFVNIVRRQAASLHSTLQGSLDNWAYKLILRLATSSHKSLYSACIRKFCVTSIDGQIQMVTNPSVVASVTSNHLTYLQKLQANLDDNGHNRRKLEFYNEHRLVSVLKSPQALRTGSLKGALKTGSVISASIDSTCQSASMPVRPRKKVRMDTAISMQDRAPVSDPVVASMPPIQSTPIPLEIEDLCEIFTQNASVDSCIGYLAASDKRRHEFSHLHGSSQDLQEPHFDLISLDSLLESSRRQRLTRKERLRLASITASSLLQLQTTPWIDGTLTKKDIYFEQTPSRIVSETPYIRQKPQSLPENESAFAVPPTPAQIRRQTCASLTSLGILLLELLFDSPIEAQHDLRAAYFGEDGKPHNDTDYLAAKEWLEDLEDNAGKPCMDAVKACFEFDTRPNWEDDRFVASTYGRVVKGLEHVLEEHGWLGSSDR